MSHLSKTRSGKTFKPSQLDQKERNSPTVMTIATTKNTVTPSSPPLLSSTPTEYQSCKPTDDDLTHDDLKRMNDERVNSGSSMKIFIKTITGGTLTLDVYSYDTIYTVKQLIYFNESITPAQIMLIFAGMALDNNRLLSDYNIQKETKLHMLLQLRGS